MAVFINNGAAGPGFQDPVFYDTGGSYAGEIAVGDLDGDGHPDVVMGGIYGQQEALYVYSNLGQGSMENTGIFPVMTTIGGLQVGNVAGHNDGRSDVLMAGPEYYRTSFTNPTTYARSALQILVNRGDDSYFLTPIIPAGTSVALAGQPTVQINGVAILGYNTAGTANVLVASHIDGSANQIGFTASTDGEGLISGLKVSPSFVATYKTAPQSSMVAVGDINGDGRPDIVTGVNPYEGGAAVSGNVSASLVLNSGSAALASLLSVSAMSDAVGNAAKPGQIIHYTIFYKNNGTAPAANVTLGAYVVTTGSYLNGSASDGGTAAVVHGKTLLKWSFGSIAPQGGGSESFAVTVLPTGSVNKKITGGVAIAQDLKPEDAAPLPKIVVQNPIMLTATAASIGEVSGTVAKIGDTITYTMTYSNTGSLPAQNVVLTSNVPAKTSLASNGGGTPSFKGSTERVQWTIGTLAAGASGSESFTVTVNAPPLSSPKAKTKLTDMCRLDSPPLPTPKVAFPPILIIAQ